PKRIQDFLEKIPANFEKKGETCRSPVGVLRHREAHCLEGAILAAACLKLCGHRPLILDLAAHKRDLDHVVAPFKINNHWGAISKSNHAVLRYREPIYKNIRELVISYFHEYFLDNGRKTLRSYSNPVDLSRFDKKGWMTAEKDVWYIERYLRKIPHQPILTKTMIKNLRRADPVEILAGKLTQWK
ncbi:MAG: hypothetical protein U1C57_03675, partial [Candidatus Doudnabacteria bacterium]|nr:hypothetical protein [Candidatus Doudnabacteria bacterium]